MAFVDFKLIKNNYGLYDINFIDGDIEITQGFETSLLMTVLCERRASASEISIAQKRRGWWGNAFLGYNNFEQGSKLWLLSQARADQLTLNNAKTFLNNALQWYITDSLLSNFTVDTSYNAQKELLIKISLIISSDIVLSKYFKLWQNTIQELENDIN
ncbi:MAG: phage GP46 family protein [Candidatus Pacearchaeota archaeon]|jgi:phage gp46-like protein